MKTEQASVFDVGRVRGCVLDADLLSPRISLINAWVALLMYRDARNTDGHVCFAIHSSKQEWAERRKN